MTLHPFPHPKPRREPVEATSGYLNLPLRTEAEVISLLREREKRMPVQRPVDTEPA